MAYGNEDQSNTSEDQHNTSGERRTASANDEPRTASDKHRDRVTTTSVGRRKSVGYDVAINIAASTVCFILFLYLFIRFVPSPTFHHLPLTHGYGTTTAACTPPPNITATTTNGAIFAIAPSFFFMLSLFFLYFAVRSRPTPKTHTRPVEAPTQQPAYQPAHALTPATSPPPPAPSSPTTTTRSFVTNEDGPATRHDDENGGHARAQAPRQ
jgi:hypothetical protein